jgi:hypothetical protein
LIILYNNIIVSYNLLTPKGIPYRSETLADFFEGTILDELKNLML